MTRSLAMFSTLLSRLVAATAPVLTAIRIGPNRHVTGLLCQDDTIVTTDQALPALDHFTIVLPDGKLAAARPGPRDRVANLAELRLEAPLPVLPLGHGDAAPGSVAVVLAADADAHPTVRLSVVHRFVTTANGAVPILDLTAERVDQGALVLTPDGCLIGLTDLGANGEAFVVPSAAIARAISPVRQDPAEPAVAARRGWLGVALQPITVPGGLATRTGHKSGRMVVRITPGGPADRGGLRIGDVLLAINGTSTSGPHTLRAFLGADRVGSTVEVKLLRDGALLTAPLVVEGQPRAQLD